MPQFQVPDCIVLNGHPSTSSMIPLMANGHSPIDDDTNRHCLTLPVPLDDHGVSEDSEDTLEDDPGLFLSFRKHGMWKDRTSLEKFLAGLLLVCVIGFLTVVILLATGPRNKGTAL